MSGGRVVRFGDPSRYYEVEKAPLPHILVASNKTLHGWWKGKRECTSERMLINPYNGCSVNCLFCYSQGFPGYFQLFRREGIVTLFRDFDRSVAHQLDSISVASCGYLSPVTDPFQRLNETYRLSERIVDAFVERNVPICFSTKSRVPQRVIDRMREQTHSFGQVSILTPKEELRRGLMEEGACTDELFGNLTRLRDAGLSAVLRIDPIIPHLTDAKDELKDLVQRAVDSGSTHVVASVMDIPVRIFDDLLRKFKRFGTGFSYDLGRLYRERLDGYQHARIEYRKSVFDRLRNLCDSIGISFALCMEYEVLDGRPVGLNPEFMSSVNCDGTNIPLYKRMGKTFKPACNCRGDCLNCKDPLCGVEDLAMGRYKESKKDFTLKDYRRWSREMMD